MLNKLKAKLQASTSSATIGVAGGVVGVAVLLQTYPGLINVVPEQYRPLALALIGVAVAVARLRSLGAAKSEPAVDSDAPVPPQ